MRKSPLEAALGAVAQASGQSELVRQFDVQPISDPEVRPSRRGPAEKRCCGVTFGVEALEQVNCFAEVDIDWRSPPAESETLLQVDGDGAVGEVVNENVRRLNNLLFGPQDYALIATR